AEMWLMLSSMLRMKNKVEAVLAEEIRSLHEHLDSPNSQRLLRLFEENSGLPGVIVDKLEEDRLEELSSDDAHARIAFLQSTLTRFAEERSLSLFGKGELERKDLKRQKSWLQEQLQLAENSR
ncbi:hypothetical protein FOZ63_018537, partial [Perkinsus olseni]